MRSQSSGPHSCEDASEVAGKSDDELLRCIGSRDENQAVAREAWAEFYRRHVDYLYAVCYRAYAPLVGDTSGVSDLVADTFRRVFEKGKSFDPDGLREPDALRVRARAWIGAIAANLARDALRRRRKIPTKLLEQDEWQNVAERSPDAGVESENLLLIREAMASLTEREQLVLRITFQWYQVGTEQQRLPPDVLADLAATLDTSPENIRQIRRRALKRIRDFVRGAMKRQEEAL